MGLRLIYTSTKVASFANYKSPVFYVPHWDAFLMIANTNTVFKIFRDGTIINYGTALGDAYYMAMNEARIALGNFWDSWIFETDPFLFQPIYTKRLNDVPFTWQQQSSGDFIDDIARVVYNRKSNGTVDVRSLVTGAVLRTETIGCDGNTNQYNFFCVGKDRFGGYSPAYGKFFIYDYSAKTLVGKWFVEVGKAGCYDSLYSLFWLMTSTNHFKVFSMEDCGNTLSNPTFEPTGNRYKMAGYVLSTRLTGSTGYPIPYKQITWTLTNSKGWLEHAYSTTDENGYAKNYYWCPKESPLGSETITVMVVI